MWSNNLYLKVVLFKLDSSKLVRNDSSKKRNGRYYIPIFSRILIKILFIHVEYFFLYKVKPKFIFEQK